MRAVKALNKEVILLFRIILLINLSQLVNILMHPVTKPIYSSIHNFDIQKNNSSLKFMAGQDILGRMDGDINIFKNKQLDFLQKYNKIVNIKQY